MTQLRVVAAERQRENGKPDPASSILKIKGTEIQQATTELLLEVVGPYALPYQRRADEDGWNEPPIGPDWAGPARADLFQLAQDLDLRRLERDPEEHHRQGDTGTLNMTRVMLGRQSERRAGDPRPRAGAIDRIAASRFGMTGKRGARWISISPKNSGC